MTFWQEMRKISLIRFWVFAVSHWETAVINVPTSVLCVKLVNAPCRLSLQNHYQQWKFLQKKKNRRREEWTKKKVVQWWYGRIQPLVITCEGRKRSRKAQTVQETWCVCPERVERRFSLSSSSSPLRLFPLRHFCALRDTWFHQHEGMLECV